MIVCLCHAVSDREVRALASAGADVETVARATGAGTDCGSCREELVQLVRSTRRAESPAGRATRSLALAG